MNILLEYINIGLYFITFLFAMQLFLYKQSEGIQNRILGLYMLFLCILFSLSSFTPEQKVLELILNSILDFVFYSIQPLFYFYLIALTNERFIIKRKYVLHFFLPIFIFLINNFHAIFILIDNRLFETIHQYIYENHVYIYLYYSQFVYYLVIISLRLFYFQKSIKHFFSDIENNSLNWLWFVLSIYCITNIFDMIITLTSLLSGNNIMIYMKIFAFIYVLLLGFFGVKQNDIYTPFELKNENIYPFVTEKNDETERDITISEKALSESLIQTIYDNILSVLNQERVYLNSSLTSSELAKLLNTNRTYLSIVIHEKFNTNFYNLINSYRVEEAKKYLSDEEFHKYTLDAIAEMSGFATRTVFYRTFKRLVNETPAEFKKKSMKLKE